MRRPWSDCPTCPACSMPCGSEKRGAELYGRRGLACCACGHFWKGSKDEVAQARAADAAWEAECARHAAIAREQLTGEREE